MNRARHVRRATLALLTTAILLSPVWAGEPPSAGESFTIESSAFSDGRPIPKRFTCQGDDTSPPLRWSGVPEGARSLALVVDDPDAPGTVWVHWVLYGLPPEPGELGAGAARGELPEGTKPGTNSWKRTGYGGPCPPSGRHRYVFKLYALDTTLALDEPTKGELEEAMRGHVIAEARLMGTYEKER